MRCILTLVMCASSLLLAACGGGGGSSVPEPPPPLPDPQYLASGPTPFAAGCDGIAASGTLYVNAEVEPFVAVNPRDATNLVGVWQQDRWSSGGARGLLTGISFDGGVTWAPRMAAFSRCTGGTPANGGDYERASDPWVSFGPDGTAHQIAIAFNGRNFAAGSVNAVLASRSTDGGRTWSAPATLIRDGADAFNDKESITADPTDARYVYAVWDRLDPAGHGPTWFARSVDGGRTWEAARGIYDPGERGQTINNQIVVLADGTLVDFFTQFVASPTGSTTATLMVIRSVDKGATWSAPIAIAPVQAVGARDPDAGTQIRDGANLGSIAAGRDATLVAVWQDGRFSGGTRDGIAFVRSIDGGLTWSAPVRINAVPSVAAFVPAVHVRGDGTIGVTYYDLRNNTSDPGTLPTDYWLTRSADGINWRETHISGPFDLAAAPNALGLFLGDYQGLASIGSVFVPFYGRTDAGMADNRSDIYAGLMGSAPTAAAASVDALRGGSAERPGESLVRAEPADVLPMTPELARRLDESIARTIARRARGGDE